MNELELLMMSAIVSIAMCVITAIYVVITAIYVWITHAILKAMIRPCVIIYSKPHPLNPIMMLVVIENIGKSLAKNVRFSVPTSLQKTKDINERTFIQKVNNILHNGIPALAPGNKVEIQWGMYNDLYELISDKKFEVACKYDLGKTKNYLEIHSRRFEQSGYCEDGSWQSAKYLERIHDTLNILS